MKDNNLTPLLKQYFEIKKQYPDEILFFRMGDFYEMFFDDAIKAAPILEIVLTTRDKKKEDKVPMCGIPYHARDTYAIKLLRKGFKVAICEQVEDPALTKGIVKREVVKVLTPATAIEIENLGTDINNFILSIYKDENHISIASIDLSVSDFEVKNYSVDNYNSFVNEFYRKMPKEVVIPKGISEEVNKIIKAIPEMNNILVNELEDYEFNKYELEEVLKNQFNIQTIEGLGLKGYDSAIISSGILVKYLKRIRKSALSNISNLKFIPKEDFLILDSVSFRNLEIVKNLRTNNVRGSLFDSIDLTLTLMGKRLLKKWISYPLIDKEEINRRVDGIEEFLNNLIARTEIRKILKGITDLSRINSKIALNLALPIHLLSLKDILKRIPELEKNLEVLKSDINHFIKDELDSLDYVIELIEKSISNDPSNNINEGNFIKKGYNKRLDELRAISRDAKVIIATMEKDEKSKTGIPTLKIKYNKVFGYFIEVTKTHLRLIPDNYIRKQTLVNAERFITDELKKLEEKILKAEEKIVELEKQLYSEVITDIQKYSDKLNRNAELIALLDVLTSGAELSGLRNYVKPVITDKNNIYIKNGRHPVVEINMASKFIPNDLNISSDKYQILIITGPNMGGKSTYLRQNALIVILAQSGYFVPAESAEIGICDRIFTRIGASDSLIEGKSTFLIEMIETSIILNNATEKSLILLDEIGRGTSTFDGVSIAWAVIEYLHSLDRKPKTLFATHYHELTELGDVLDRVKNLHIAVKEWQDNVIFLHKVEEGASDQSFGIHVAKIAGLPVDVIERAKEILLNLEKKELNRLVKERLTGKIQKLPEQKSLFDDQEFKIWDEIRKKLLDIDISNITPLEALNILHFLKHKAEYFK